MKFKVGDKIKIKNGQPLRPADYDLGFHPDMIYEISGIPTALELSAQGISLSMTGQVICKVGDRVRVRYESKYFFSRSWMSSRKNLCHNRHCR